MNFTFNLDEQIFMRNDKSNKVYTLTINRGETPAPYEVTREWTVPNQDQLASKTDSFPLFKQAAEFMQKHYNERLVNGYIEIMRREGIKKRGAKVEKHKGNEKISTIPDEQKITGTQPGKIVQDSIHSRQRTSIHDRLEFLKNFKKS